LRTELWRLSVPQEEHCRAWVPERNVRVRDLVHSSRRELAAGRGTRPVCEDLERA